MPDRWQPIETMPKDRTILVWDEFYAQVCDAKWVEGSEYLKRLTGETIFEPTHWMEWPGRPESLPPELPPEPRKPLTFEERCALDKKRRDEMDRVIFAALDAQMDATQVQKARIAVKAAFTAANEANEKAAAAAEEVLRQRTATHAAFASTDSVFSKFDTKISSVRLELDRIYRRRLIARAMMLLGIMILSLIHLYRWWIGS